MGALLVPGGGSLNDLCKTDDVLFERKFGSEEHHTPLPKCNFLCLFFDIKTCKATFIKNPLGKARIYKNFPVSVIIFCAHHTVDHIKSIKKHLKNLTGRQIHVLERLRSGPVFEPYISAEKARALVTEIVFSQRYSRIRDKILFPLGPLLYKTVEWRIANKYSLCASESTVRGYLSVVRAFAHFCETPVESVLRSLAFDEIDNSDIREFLWFRFTEVRIEAVLKTFSAFNWFYRLFQGKSFSAIHGETHDWIKKFQKKLEMEAEGADALTWEQLQQLLLLVRQYDWKHFDAKDIFRLAVISFFGALRISESISLSHETTSWNPANRGTEVVLRIYDGKTHRGNLIDMRILPHYRENTFLSPVFAWQKLCKKSSTGCLVKNFKGEPLTED